MDAPPRRGPLLRDLGEDALIARLCALTPVPPGTAAGPGDDCAVVDEHASPGPDDRLLLLKTDAIVEAVHFTPGTEPERVGWKAVARLASDFAAMGGTPGRFLVTLALPPDREVAWVEGLYRGIARGLVAVGGALAGGETSAVPVGSAAVISLAATGHVARRHLVLRSTARVGDGIYVTGAFGGSFASGRHLDIRPRLAEAAWLVRQFKPGAMMDLSDGPAADLPKLARASGTGFEVDRAALPRHAGVSIEAAWNDGEDFELLLTQPPEHDTAAFTVAWRERFPEVALTRIGRIISADAEPGHRLPGGGWRHFQGAGPRI